MVGSTLDLHVSLYSRFLLAVAAVLYSVVPCSLLFPIATCVHVRCSTTWKQFCYHSMLWAADLVLMDAEVFTSLCSAQSYSCFSDKGTLMPWLLRMIEGFIR